MSETLVHLTDEKETESIPEPKPKRVKVCAGAECAGKHRGRCQAKHSPRRRAEGSGRTKKARRQMMLDTMRLLALSDDAEQAHIAADAALLAYIADADIDAAFNAIKKHYA